MNDDLDSFTQILEDLWCDAKSFPGQIAGHDFDALHDGVSPQAHVDKVPAKSCYTCWYVVLRRVGEANKTYNLGRGCVEEIHENECSKETSHTGEEDGISLFN